MESEDPSYVYSGALLAYVHLSNALKNASYDDWIEASSCLDEAARRDLKANDEYWAQFKSPITDMSETAYDGFLQNQSQALGMKSYGACVDLLVAWGEMGK